jgi:hypothetical protein
MSKKSLIIIVISIFILVMVFVAILLFMQSRQLDEVRPEADVNQIVIDNVLINRLEQLPSPSADVVSDETDYTLGLKQLAFTFAERFGTYSSDDNFNSWQGLDVLTTNRMRDYIGELIVSSAYDPDVYEVYSTKALSSRIRDINSANNRAIVLVKTQRSHAINDESELYYQDILIDFILIDDEWKVDGVRWQN